MDLGTVINNQINVVVYKVCNTHRNVPNSIIIQFWLPRNRAIYTRSAAPHRVGVRDKNNTMKSLELNLKLGVTRELPEMISVNELEYIYVYSPTPAYSLRLVKTYYSSTRLQYNDLFRW